MSCLHVAAPGETYPETPPPVFNPDWPTPLPAVIYTPPENPPVSSIQDVNIPPPSYSEVMESQPSPASISRQPGRGSLPSAPMLEDDIPPPPSYEAVTASPLSFSPEIL